MTEQEMVQKIYEVIKLVDCMQYNPSVDFNYLRAKGAYNIIKNQVEHIEAENSELRATLSKMETVEARLDKAVELPCKIGDEVYEIHAKCDGHNCPYNGGYGQWRCSYGREPNCAPFITAKKFCYSDIPRVGKTIFVSKKDAEARLAELKGEKK